MDRYDAVLPCIILAPCMIASGLIVANVVATPILVMVGVVLFYVGLALLV